MAVSTSDGGLMTTNSGRSAWKILKPGAQAPVLVGFMKNVTGHPQVSSNTNAETRISGLGTTKTGKPA